MITKQEFLSRVDTSGSCHLWKAAKIHGYGVFNVDGRQVRAHRFAAYLFNGFDLSSPLQVCHSCDNRACVNPRHLFVGDAQANMADKVSKGRQCIGIARNGIRRNAAAKLTLEQVRAARVRLANGEGPVRIAREFGVAHQTIHALATGRTWQQVV